MGLGVLETELTTTTIWAESLRPGGDRRDIGPFFSECLGLKGVWVDFLVI